MNAKSYFLDSNIWLYIFLNNLDNPENERKREIAIALTEAENIVISTQVINEVCVNLLKKYVFNEEQMRELIQDFYISCTIVELNLDIIISASILRSRYLFSYWDSLIVASALYAGVEIIYSEDMQNGLTVSEKIKIVNPFRL